MNQTHHISVCICTYKRPKLLKRLFSHLEVQETGGYFDYSLVIVDNDITESARNTVEIFSTRSKISVDYYIEPEQGIALARNKAISGAKGDLVAFIDDDEFPEKDWLLNHFLTLFKYNCTGVLGPVIPHFDVQPPSWVVKCKLFDRPTHNTGFILPWNFTRTGNVLLKREIFQDSANIFNSDYITGEDKEFFKRMTVKGHEFVWCNEAPVYEVVPPIRWSWNVLVKRALLRGKNAANHGAGGLGGTLKTVSAIAIYTTLLPVFFILGKHVFVKYLIKDLDHIGKLLTLLKFNVAGDLYITE